MLFALEFQGDAIFCCYYGSASVHFSPSATCSGKTSVALQLQKIFPHSILIQQDKFYLVSNNYTSKKKEVELFYRPKNC